jgi:hypothetical protein
MTSWKRLTFAVVSAAALLIVGLTPTSANADRRHGHGHGHHGHGHHGHGHHGHWHHGHGHHGHWRHSHWHHRPYLAGPPIVLRSSYYPVQYYYSPPVWYDYGYISPYYGSGLYYYGW